MFTQNYSSFREMMFFNDNSESTTSKPRVNAFHDTANTKFGHSANYRISPSYSLRGDIGHWLTSGKCGAVASGVQSGNVESSTSGGVYFGTGATPANKTDFKLEAPITTGLEIINQNKPTITDESDGKYSISAEYIIKNTTDAEINIYEIGIFTNVGRSTSAYYTVLMERTVLTEPITILPGTASVVTYKITFNQILNVE